MTLNDEQYSRMVNLYRDLDDHKIHELNARLILLLTAEIKDQKILTEIFDKLENEKKF